MNRALQKELKKHLEYMYERRKILFNRGEHQAYQNLSNHVAGFSHCKRIVEKYM